MPSSVGGKPGDEPVGGGALSRHRKLLVSRVGDSTLERGGETDFVGVSGTPPGTSSESREKNGGAEV